MNAPTKHSNLHAQSNTCKICGNGEFDFYAHTARCKQCKVLLYWPYPPDDSELIDRTDGKAHWLRKDVLNWYILTGFRNHSNFTAMLRYTLDESFAKRPIDVLDYGGGGGQFALVCLSHFPLARTHLVDISDESLLNEWRSVNHQIPFRSFADNAQTFDAIFMNDVFEHVSDPIGVLKQLATKLKPGGRIFVDTPMQFWLYPISKLLSGKLHTKVLRGTVTTAHLQIWSKQSFLLAAESAGLTPLRYSTVSEYTMPAANYLDGMNISNPAIRLAGHVFYRLARYIARNKIMCVLVKQPVTQPLKQPQRQPNNAA